MTKKTIDIDYRNDPDRLMQTPEVAMMLGMTVQSLIAYRQSGKGPVAKKLTSGRYGRVRYRRQDVLDYINSRERIEPVSEVA